MAERTGATTIITGALSFVAGFSINELFKDLIDSKFKPTFEEEHDESDEGKLSLKRRRIRYAAARIIYTIILITVIILIVWAVHKISDETQIAMYNSNSITRKNNELPTYNTGQDNVT